MPPRKRANDGEPATTRSKKAAKTENGESAPKSKGRKGPSAPEFKEFKAKALPIHVAFTHTPPSIEKGKDGSADKDEGYIGNLTLVPTKFQTTSYGWKGTKRIQVELVGEDGEKEKVTVQIQVNATVHGSKNAAKDGEDDDGDAKDEEDKEEDAAEE
ncbi:hypothetical protein EXIGLDRAFT_762911 [Exidia glandulosa HHB12029]|uniref:Uncharacterized protein n=1 Tax=Exidia glandulosa HHB12029 TaxID=1314781 RepID=A0A165ME88_EXIGL|nr:hypothetical protein EXIGLDRAFT_762911 [Exidia glandulosa HHB12029]